MSTQAAPAVPGYDVEAPLGSGASASVWRARRRVDGLAVALKVVRPIAGDVGSALREAGLLAGVRHRHVVHLYDVLPLTDPAGDRPSAVVLVTQLGAGGSLAQLLARRRILSPGELVTVLQPLAGALADLHEQGVVHGDLSPGNVVFRADGMPLLADLGTARVVGERGEVWATGAGEGMVAPEVLEGFPPTRESDVYQLGALAWYALVGEPPGLGHDRPPFAQVAPDLVAGLVELVARCMAPQPEDRPDAEELATVLMGVADPEPVEVAPEADPAHGVTTRLRQMAQEDAATQEETAPTPWWRRRPGRRARLARGRVGAHRAGERVSGGGPSEGVQRSSPWAVATVFLVSAVAGALLFGLLVVPLRGILAADAPAAGPVGAAPGPDTHTATATATEKATSTATATEQAAAPPPAGETAAAADGGDPASATAGPDRVRASVQQVVDARATAWEASDPALLAAAVAADSPAQAADAAELERARESGISYPAVDFTVRAVEVLEQDDERLRVVATVVRAALEARDERGWVLRTPEQTDRVELELIRQDGRWLLWSWAGPAR